MKNALPLLRAGRRHRSGTRTWIIPGYDNAASLVPAAFSYLGEVTFHWPDVEPANGHEFRQGVSLRRNRNLAKAAARRMIEKVEADVNRVSSC